jgi:hypothetical protein
MTSTIAVIIKDRLLLIAEQKETITRLPFSLGNSTPATTPRLFAHKFPQLS